MSDSRTFYATRIAHFTLSVIFRNLGKLARVFVLQQPEAYLPQAQTGLKLKHSLNTELQQQALVAALARFSYVTS